MNELVTRLYLVFGLAWHWASLSRHYHRMILPWDEFAKALFLHFPSFNWTCLSLDESPNRVTWVCPVTTAPRFTRYVGGHLTAAWWQSSSHTLKPTVWPGLKQKCWIWVVNRARTVGTGPLCPCCFCCCWGGGGGGGGGPVISTNAFDIWGNCPLCSPITAFFFPPAPFFLLNVTSSVLFNFRLIDPSPDFYSLLFLPRRPRTRSRLERNSISSNFLFCLCSVANWVGEVVIKCNKPDCQISLFFLQLFANGHLFLIWYSQASDVLFPWQPKFSFNECSSVYRLFRNRFIELCLIVASLCVVVWEETLVVIVMLHAITTFLEKKLSKHLHSQFWLI